MARKEYGTQWGKMITSISPAYIKKRIPLSEATWHEAVSDSSDRTVSAGGH